MSVAELLHLLDNYIDGVVKEAKIHSGKTKSMKASGKSASSAIKHNKKSLSSLKYLTLILSARPKHARR